MMPMMYIKHKLFNRLCFKLISLDTLRLGSGIESSVIVEQDLKNVGCCISENTVLLYLWEREIK